MLTTTNASNKVPAPVNFVTENTFNDNVGSTDKNSVNVMEEPPVKAKVEPTVTVVPKEKKLVVGKEFSYIVGIRDPDSGQLNAFDNSGVLFFGTQENAESLKKYAESKSQGKYEIVKV